MWIFLNSWYNTKKVNQKLNFTENTLKSNPTLPKMH